MAYTQIEASMSSYKELLQQRDTLNKQIEEARQREIGQAVEKVRALVAEFSLSQEDVFSIGRKPGRPGKTGQKVAAKYRNPTTGATWTGRGKPPKWIEGRDRSPFLIA